MIEATSISAASAGLGWYLNHYCSVNVCWNKLTYCDEKIDFPVPDSVQKRDAGGMMRYYLNYCTFSYSMAFWNWDRWQKEIDWMALHGINMPLMLVGADCVWKDVLAELGYSEKEISEFIAGPGFQAWWLMNNLQGWGGPNPEWWYSRQEKLCSNILSRMRSLGMTPVLPGYSGMLPRNAAEKLGLSVADPGKWCNVFDRPAFLSPSDPNFSRIAAIYYKHLENHMGRSQYYSMDPFHEGGDVSGTDLTLAYRSINSELHRSVPNSKWVIQSWNENPRPEALAALPYGDYVVLDLFSDGDPKWRGGYGGHDWMYCMLHNFGGRSGLHGRLYSTMKGWFDAKREMPSTLFGIGATPEGLETNPVLYDALFELPWMSEEECEGWLERYTLARYGCNNPDADRAWQIIAASALNCPTNQQGSSEPVVCANPSFDVDRVSTWGTCKLSYDPQELVKALEYMRKAEAELSDNGNFRYDFNDLQRQVITDSCQIVLKDIKNAFERRRIEDYNKGVEKFLNNILRLDALMSPFPEFNMDDRLRMAESICDEAEASVGQAVPEKDRQWMKWNLRTLVTSWSSEETAIESGLLDYSNREWSVLLKEYYFIRWKSFFEQKNNYLCSN